jgi:hypothetical protein
MMKPSLAAMFVLVFGILFLADPMICPDGCGDGSLSDRQEVSLQAAGFASVCSWCLGISNDTKTPMVSVEFLGLDQPHSLPAELLLGSIRNVDHPPRG